MELKRQGYTIEQKTICHFRINGVVDVFPIHNRWHDLRTNTRGGAKDLPTLVKENVRHNEGLLE